MSTGGERRAQHTVDSNGHCFCQDESICTHEGRDSTQRIELEVFDILDGGPGLDKLNIEIVFFCDSQQDCCPRVFLLSSSSQLGRTFTGKKNVG